MESHIYIQNGNTVYEPVINGGISWETQRKGQPGKLSFSMVPDQILNIEEGNAVRLDIDGTPVFFGFLFERTWGKDGEVKATVYDQLRYLKNKDSYNYTDMTAGELIQKIALDYHLRTGVIEDTGYKIPFRKSQDKALFDAILDAMDITMLHMKKIYVLYDSVGELTLRDVENLKIDVLQCKKTAEDYDFKTSIDSSTYNQIKLYRDNEETKKRDIYLTIDSENINKWGILQYDEAIDKGVDGQTIAEAYFQLYNKPTKSLSIKGALGDIRVRAGCLVPVILDVKDLRFRNYMLVESVTHSLEDGFHTMNLSLKGAGVNA